MKFTSVHVLHRRQVFNHHSVVCFCFFTACTEGFDIWKVAPFCSSLGLLQCGHLTSHFQLVLVHICWQPSCGLVLASLGCVFVWGLQGRCGFTVVYENYFLSNIMKCWYNKYILFGCLILYKIFVLLCSCTVSNRFAHWLCLESSWFKSCLEEWPSWDFLCFSSVLPGKYQNKSLCFHPYLVQFNTYSLLLNSFKAK